MVIDQAADEAARKNSDPADFGNGRAPGQRKRGDLHFSLTAGQHRGQSKGPDGASCDSGARNGGHGAAGFRKLRPGGGGFPKQIATLIEAVQSEARLAVQAAEEGTMQVAEGVATTQKAGEALKQIIHVSQEVGDMVTHIATTATQQSRATEDINNRMNQVARLLIESAGTPSNRKKPARISQDWRWT